MYMTINLKLASNDRLSIVGQNTEISLINSRNSNINVVFNTKCL